MGRRWRQWDETTARAVLAEFDASGLTMTAFARERGLCVQRVRRWRDRLEASPPRGRFIELVATTAVAELAVPDETHVVVEWPSGPRLLVPPAALDALLAGLARVLPC